MSYAQPGAHGRGVRRAPGVLCAGLLALVLMALTLMALGLPAAPAAAGAGPDAGKPPPDESLPAEPVPGGFRSWAELLAVQEELNNAAARLLAGAERAEGFTGIPPRRRTAGSGCSGTGTCPSRSGSWSSRYAGRCRSSCCRPGTHWPSCSNSSRRSRPSRAWARLPRTSTVAG